ncbi:MAG: hypothetical protein O7B27_08885 [Gammaproteobacteria bacterium]|nr:hypothetical protein [Gammaproteobacteria bacterium]
MGYLIGQILLCLLAAALIGLFVGWWFTRQWSRYRLADVQVSWQSRLTEIQKQLAERNSALSTMKTELHARDERVGSLKQELLDKDVTLNQLQANLGSLKTRSNDAEDQLREQHAKVTSLEDQRERYHQELSDRDTKLKTMTPRLDGLEQQLARRDSALKDLESARESTVAKKKSEIESLKGRIKNLEPLAPQLSETEQALTNLRFTLAEKDGEIGALRANLDESSGQAKERDARIRELEPLIGRLKEREKAFQELEKKHNSAVDQKTSEVERRRKALSELEPIRGELDARTEALKQLEIKHQSMIDDNSMVIMRLNGRLKELEPLELQLQERDARICELEPAGVQLKESEARVQALEERHRSLLQEKVREFETLRHQLLELEHQPAAVVSPGLSGQEFHEPKLKDRPSRDDLKKIFGIGPVLERTLNGLGYYQFRDIARWGDAEIEQVARVLNPDRIRRDKWISQAKSLHQKKYGKEL